jgi:lysylphosphatidylglycerol synthetase-like protein (DUF2156 family)
MEDTIVIGRKADEKVFCSNCNKELLASDAHCYEGEDKQDVYICSDCKEGIDKEFEAETTKPNWLGAIGLGIAAALVGAVVWVLVAVIFEVTIGYVAIGVGFIVGWGVILGSGKKRGIKLQITSTVITLATILLAEYATFIYFVTDYVKEAYPAETADMSIFWVTPFDPDFLSSLASPMGLFIWAIGLYVAFIVPKARKI